MNRSNFSEQISEFRTKVDRVRQRVNRLEITNSSGSPLLDDLLTSMEELQVAEEELFAQDEALDLSYFALEASNDHYRALFESAPWVYLLTDENGVIREANLEASSVFNIDQKYLIGKPLSLFVNESDRSLFRNHLQTLQNSSKVHKWEMLIIPRQGVFGIPVAVTCAREQVVGSISSSQYRWLLYDLTLQKEAEAAEREKVFRSVFEQAAVGMAYLSPDGKWIRVNNKLSKMLGYTPEEFLQTDYQSFTYAEDVSISIDGQRRLLHHQVDSLSLEQRYYHKDGSLLWVSVTTSLITDSSQRPIYLIAIIEDIQTRKQAEMSEKAQRETAEMLQATAMNLTSSLDLNQVFQRVLESLKQVAAYDTASIFIIQGEFASVVHQSGYKEANLTNLETDINNLQIPRSLFSELLTKHLPSRDQQLHDVIFRYMPQINTVQSVLFSPLISGDTPIGFLMIQYLSSKTFSETQLNAITAFAQQSVVAIQNARLHQTSQELAVLKDRQRVARDLHDSVSQNLFSSVVITETLLRSLYKDEKIVHKYLENLELLNRSAMAEMQILLLELRPEQLLKMSFKERITQLVEATRGRKTLDFDIQIDSLENVSPEVLVVFFRVVQESLNNIIKHSLAKHVSIILRDLDARLSLTVHDDGLGFDTTDTYAGFGLSSMSERAQEIFADLTITSQVEQGTTVRMIWERPTSRSSVN